MCYYVSKIIEIIYQIMYQKSAQVTWDIVPIITLSTPEVTTLEVPVVIYKF